MHRNKRRRYSITSSAVVSSDGRIVRPSVFAVFRFDDELEICGLHHWKIGRLLALENSPGVNTHLAIPVYKVVSVTNKTADFDEFA